MPNFSDDILDFADNYLSCAESYCQGKMTKLAVIKKLPSGKYRVLSEKGKNLGTYDSKEKAKKRLKQVEYFKHLDESSANDEAIDLSNAEEFSLSAILRQMRQNASSDQVLEFLKIFNSFFNKAVKNNLQSPERVALQKALVDLNKRYKITLDKDIIKNAAITELGHPQQVGNYLANMIRFILLRISPEKRQKAIDGLKHKIYHLNEVDISDKNLPASAAIGQSITLVKNVLFNHNHTYVRAVINSLVRSL